MARMKDDSYSSVVYPVTKRKDYDYTPNYSYNPGSYSDYLDELNQINYYSNLPPAPTDYQPAVNTGMTPINRNEPKDNADLPAGTLGAPSFTPGDYIKYVGGQTAAPTAPQVYQRPKRDYMAEALSIFKPLKENSLTNIRNAFNKIISGFNAQKPLQDQYKYGALNDVDSAYAKGQQGLNAAMEAAGQKGGENITGQIALGAARGNGVNEVNQTYTNNISAIDAAVRAAQGDQTAQETGLENEFNSKVADWIANQQARDAANDLQTTQMMGRDSSGNLTLAAQNQNFNQDLALKEYGDTAADRELQRQIDTVSQWSGDYQGRINQLEATNPNDPTLPYLKIARQQKIKDEQTMAANKAALQTKADQERWDNALEVWKQSGVATKEIASILGIPVGTKTAAYDIDKLKIDQVDRKMTYEATRDQMLNEQWMARYSLDEQKQIADEAYKNSQITQAEYNGITARINAEATKKNSETNETKANKPASTDNKPQVTSTQYQNFIEDNYFSKQQIGTDDNGNPIYSQNKVLKDKQALAKYITSLIDSGVDESITDALFAKYGISLADLVNDRNR